LHAILPIAPQLSDEMGRKIAAYLVANSLKPMR
jgi:hypothetical protein